MFLFHVDYSFFISDLILFRMRYFRMVILVTSLNIFIKVVKDLGLLDNSPYSYDIRYLEINK